MRHNPKNPDVPYGYCACDCGEKTNLSSVTQRRSGWVAGEPMFFILGHSVRGRKLSPPPETRYEELSDGCWEWQGPLKGNGYGLVIRKAEKMPSVYAHRFFYEHFVGPIPEDLDLDHLCRNHGCVNPSHLEPVTRAVNVRRGDAAKLTESQARKVKSLEGVRSAIQIGKDFGIHRNTVYAVWRGRTWRDV